MPVECRELTRDEKCIRSLNRKNQKTVNMTNLDVDGRIILKYIYAMYVKANWVQRAQNREQ